MSQPIQIATWNVNSIKARLEHACRWLTESGCDVVLLQELKCEADAFPHMEIEELGYNIELVGQKTYNGVAILSKLPIEDVTFALPGDETDVQARYIEAVIGGENPVRVASIYVPNGNEIGSEKFAYKMAFYDRLYAHAQRLLALDEPVILGADYNVAPEPVDVYDAAKLEGSVCYHADERAKLRALMHLGYYDAFRALNPNEQQFSWWDYRGGSYAQNKGLRIDHLLCNAHAMDRVMSCIIDESPRGWEKPSDHAPVMATLHP